jgi:hypothetical protein
VPGERLTPQMANVITALINTAVVHVKTPKNSTNLLR